MTHTFRIPNKQLEYHGVNIGYSLRDTIYINEHDNFTLGPVANIIASISDEEDDDDTIDKVDYCCADCESLLDYIRPLDKYKCPRCVNTDFLDITKHRLLKRSDLAEDGVLYVSADTRKYEKMEDYIEQGTKIQLFIQSINPDTLDTDENKGYEIVRQSPNKRFEHRKVTDYSKLTEALKF
jgi:hypothetical protein